MRRSCAYAPLPVARCGRLPTWTRTRSERALLVIFSPDGEDDDAQLVTNGKRAAVTAVLMIAMRGEAQPPRRDRHHLLDDAEFGPLPCLRPGVSDFGRYPGRGY